MSLVWPHTYRPEMRQALCVRQRLDVESLIETFRHPWRQRHIGGGQGRQVQLGGHQGLGLNVHQDFAALLRFMSIAAH